RVIWLGDLNYCLNLSYEKARELISKKEWSKLAEKDQLVRELKKDRAFDGWTEGSLNFPRHTNMRLILLDIVERIQRPRDKYLHGTCDRILSFGKGLKLVSYKRTKKMLSDHRPVTAVYVAEVEVFCHRKLQKALTYTDAEMEDDDVIEDMELYGEVFILPYA
ncbi:hypothetical protein IFM89_014386, partial [Coptis chinensis]